MTRIADDATRLDRAIDAILHDRRGPVAEDEDGLVITARLLRRSLPRLHPDFGFEEHLAARLAAAGRLDGVPGQAPPASPRPIRAEAGVGAPIEVGHDSARRRRSLVAGGAIASGVSIALPIAGAAIVAWRRSRSSGGLL